MERRKFLGLGVAVLAASALPKNIKAEDYRTLKPATWTAHNVDDAMKALYGKTLAETTESADLKIETPDTAANGGAVPVKLKSSLSGKTIALFQDSNPESAVAVMDLNANSIIDFAFNLKLKAPEDGRVTVYAVVEGTDGKLYSAKRTLTVAKGGCEG